MTGAVHYENSRGESNSSSSSDSGFDPDIEKYGLLQSENEIEKEYASEDAPTAKPSNNFQFLTWTAINTIATIGIVS